MFKEFNEIYHFIEKFKEGELINLDSRISLIYRNYEKKPDISLIRKIKHFCKKTNRKFYLANEFKLALYLKLDGVYIPSFNKNFYSNNFSKQKNFKIIGSAHNIYEIKIKEKQKIEIIFISPVFKIDKRKNYLGLYRFMSLKKLTVKKLIALGGINKFNIKKLKLINSYGFASISFIKMINNKNEY